MGIGIIFIRASTRAKYEETSIKSDPQRKGKKRFFFFSWHRQVGYLQMLFVERSSDGFTRWDGNSGLEYIWRMSTNYISCSSLESWVVDNRNKSITECLCTWHGIPRGLAYFCSLPLQRLRKSRMIWSDAASIYRPRRVGFPFRGQRVCISVLYLFLIVLDIDDRRRAFGRCVLFLFELCVSARTGGWYSSFFLFHWVCVGLGYKMKLGY